MIKRKIFIVLLFLSYVIMSHAQQEFGGIPRGEEHSHLRSASALPYVAMPEFNIQQIEKEDSITGYKNGAFRFAYKMETDIDVIRDGQKLVLSDGTTIYRIGITSAGAHSLNIFFSSFNIPCEAKVFVYSPKMKEIKGSYTCQNVRSSNALQVSPISGDSIIVEYDLPSSCSETGLLKVGEVNHDYKGLRAALQYDVSQPCEIDVACRDGYSRDERRAVCALITNGCYYSTGTLINNTSEDNTPYFLSAAHTINMTNKKGFWDFDPTVAEKNIFYFNYERPICGLNIKGTTEQSVFGSKVVALNAKRDMMLLKLNEIPPIDYMPYYAGWDATGEATDGGIYSYHHSLGDIKKLNYCSKFPTKGDFYYPNDGFIEGNYWKIKLWDEGMTDNGASGSALLNAEWRIIGALTGGFSGVSCASPGEDDYYRLDCNWTDDEDGSKSLSKWLDPKNSGIKKMNGKNPYSNPCKRVCNVEEGATFAPQNDQDEYESGTNSKGIKAYAERFTNNGTINLYGFYFVPYTASYESSNPIMAKIYTGTDYPEKLIHEQVLKVTTTTVNSNTLKLIDKDLSSFGQKENYLRLDSILKIKGNYFIAFEIPTDYKANFALIYAKQNQNSALFNDNDGWKEFSYNTAVNSPAALMVSTVVQSISGSNSPSIVSNKEATTYYTDSQDIIFCFANNGQKNVSLFDLSGRKLYETKTNNNTLRQKSPSGIFIAKIIAENGEVEVLKIVNLQNK